MIHHVNIQEVIIILIIMHTRCIQLGILTLDTMISKIVQIQKDHVFTIGSLLMEWMSVRSTLVSVDSSFHIYSYWPDSQASPMLDYLSCLGWWGPLSPPQPTSLLIIGITYKGQRAVRWTPIWHPQYSGSCVCSSWLLILGAYRIIHLDPSFSTTY